MKHNISRAIFLSAILVIAGCGKLDYRKTKSGLLYKIISTKNSQGPVAKPGNTLKFFFQQKLNDSVLQSNYGKLPYYQPIQVSVMNEYTPAELFTLVRKGDSAITVMLVDSLILKGRITTLPPFMKRGDRIITSFSIVDLFTSDSLMRADNTKEIALEQARQKTESTSQMAKEKKQIEDYLAANKITAQKTPKGAYVEVIDPGSGMEADSGKVVSLKYKGTTFSGQTFDTNMDSSFHHNKPFEFTVGEGMVIQGFDDGVRFLKKGGKAKIYIPGALGYGPNPVVGGGKPYENLIFEVEVLDVKNAPALQAPLKKRIDTTQRKK